MKMTEEIAEEAKRMSVIPKAIGLENFPTQGTKRICARKLIFSNSMTGLLFTRMVDIFLLAGGSTFRTPSMKIMIKMATRVFIPARDNSGMRRELPVMFRRAAL